MESKLRLTEQAERAEYTLSKICMRNGFLKTIGGVTYCEPLIDYTGRSDQLSNTISSFSVNLNLGPTTNFQMTSLDDIEAVDVKLDNLINRLKTQKRFLKNVINLTNDFKKSELNSDEKNITKIIENMDYNSKCLIKLLKQLAMEDEK